MSIYQKYQHQHFENGLYKLLFENEWSSLYIWYDSDLLVQKIQFEHRGQWAIEISQTLQTVNRLNQDGAFNQEFLMPISMDEDKRAIIQDIEIPSWNKVSRIKHGLSQLEWLSNFYLE